MIPDHVVRFSDGVNEIEFDVIAYVDDNDYSWSVSAVLSRKSDGALFWAEDVGCSCNYFADGSQTVADLVPAHSFDEAIRNAHSPAEQEKLRRSREAREVIYR